MKKIISHTWFRITTIIFFTLSSLAGFAQDKGLDVNVTVKKDNWYQQPWVWIVGGAVFILLLVALIRGGGSKKDA